MHKNKDRVTLAQATQAAEECHESTGNIPVAQVKTEATSNANVKSQDSSNENQDGSFSLERKYQMAPAANADITITPIHIVLGIIHRASVTAGYQDIFEEAM